MLAPIRQLYYHEKGEKIGRGCKMKEVKGADGITADERGADRRERRVNSEETGEKMVR